MTTDFGVTAQYQDLDSTQWGPQRKALKEECNKLGADESLPRLEILEDKRGTIAR